jgi:hypothetical protein
MSRLIDADKIIECFDPNTWQGEMMIAIAKGLPTVEPKRGEWKKGKDFPSFPRVKLISDAYYCSVCENEAFYDTDYGQQLFNFCPNCGADMR